MECIEPQNKIVKSTSKKGISHLRTKDGYRISQRSCNGNSQLCTFTKYYVVPCKCFKNCKNAKKNPCNPKNFVPDLISPAKVLVIHMKEGNHYHCMRCGLMYIAY